MQLKGFNISETISIKKKRKPHKVITRGMYLKFFTAYQQTSLLCRGLLVLWGGWGERKREHAGHSIPSSPARFLFFPLLLFLQGYPEGASAEERATRLLQVMRPTVYTTALYYDNQLFWQDREHVFLVVQLLLGNA